MPDPAVPSKPDLKTYGIEGTRLFAGLISEETVPALRGQNAFTSYRGMVQDATCSALYKSIELPIRSARWFIDPSSDDPDNVKMADFCHDTVWDFGDQSFDDVCRLALEMMPYGFAVLEILWEYITEGPWAGKVGWSELSYRAQNTKWRWNMDWIEGRRRLVSMTQLAPPFYQSVDIPREKFLLWVHEQEGSNFDGWPIFRAAYKDYWIRDQLYRLRAIGLERAYMGVPVAKIQEGFGDDLRDLARKIVETLRVDEQAGVIVPAQMMELEILFNHLQGAPMDAAISFHNRQILLSQLAQFLDLGSGVAGAYSLSSDHSELFLQACNSRADYFASVLNLEPGIPALVRLNFPKILRPDMPRLQHGDIGQRSLDALGRTLMALGQWGFLTPDNATEDRLRQMLDLPEREDNITDRSLFDLIQEVHPTYPEFGRQHPMGRLPSPLATAATAATQKGGATGGSPVPASPAGGSPSNGKATSASAQSAAKAAEFAELYARKPWGRPRGRPTESQRLAMTATEHYTEALDDFHATVRYNRGHRPPRPSEVVWQRRRPYHVRFADTMSQAKKENALPGASVAQSRALNSSRPLAVATRHHGALAGLLRPRGQTP